LLCAAQALEFSKPKHAGTGVRAAYRHIRDVVEPLSEDRPLYPDIEALVEIVRGGSLVKQVERRAGPIDLGAFPYE
jgi:histidine ammonia-lyase